MTKNLNLNLNLEDVKHTLEYRNTFYEEKEEKEAIKWLIQQVEVLTANKDGAIDMLDVSIGTSKSLADKVLRYEKALREISKWDKMMYSPTEMGDIAIQALKR